MRLIRFPLLISLAFAVLPPAAAVADESRILQCTTPELPRDELLCHDPLLDALAARAAAQEPAPRLKAWLVNEKKRCGYNSDDTIQAAAQWTAVPCLIAAYQARLAAGGRPVPLDLTRKPMGDLSLVHPLCAQLAITEDQDEDASIPLRDCNRRFSHIAIEESEGSFSSEGPGEAGASRPYFAYRVVGRLPGDVVLLETGESGGGTGRFTALAFMKGWPGADGAQLLDPDHRLTSAGGIGGGDRCNGGLSGARLTGPTTLVLNENITPYDLFLARAGRAITREADDSGYTETEQKVRNPPSQRLVSLQAYEDLDAAASSCLGWTTTEFDLAKGTSRILSITVESIGGDQGLKYQACFDTLLRGALPTLPKTLTTREVDGLARRFESTCLK